MNAESLDQWLEGLGKATYESTKGDHNSRRAQVARALGYMDARTMVMFYETYGLAVVDQALYLRKNNPDLKLDWGGLETEFYRIGKKQSSIVAMLNEAREMLD